MCICMAAGRKIVIKLPYYRSRKGRIEGGGGTVAGRGGGGLGSRKGKRMGFALAGLYLISRVLRTF